MENKYLGFPKKLIESLVCQLDAKKLVLKTPVPANHVLDGLLLCPQCSTEYIIENGILNLLPKQSGITDVMKSEIIARDESAARYDKRMLARYHKEVIPTISFVEAVKNDRIIEYGCGTGRITIPLLKEGIAILAIDFSLESLNILKEKLADSDEIGLVAADAAQFKTADNFFDKAVSFQVYEHIPTEKQRIEFLDNIKNTLKPNGIAVNSFYHQDIRRIIKNLPQEGKHRNDIFFHFFSSKEAESEFGKIFYKNKIKYLDITLPLEARLGLSGKLGGLISEIFSMVPLFKNFAHLLIVKSKKM